MTAAPRKTATETKPKRLNLDVLEAEAGLVPYEFDFAGREWSMAHMKSLDSKKVAAVGRAISNGDEEGVDGLFELALGDAWAEFDEHELSLFKKEQLINLYKDHCGIGAGE